MARASLYQAILVRRSVRRYDSQPLDEATLEQVRALAHNVQPLVPANYFSVRLHSEGVRQDLVTLLGAYGRLITSPHALVPYLQGTVHPLTDLGYRVEQIVVRLTALGIATCYIGTLPHEERARDLLGLPSDARIGALVVFGRAAETMGGRALDGLVRCVLGRAKPPVLERFFFLERADCPAQPPASLRPLIEAAVRAPSACNAQPWRFLWHDRYLSLFVLRHNPRYGPGAAQRYNLYDGGIVMANITLAMEALGMQGRWQLLSEETLVPPHPPAWLPLAQLSLAW
ncbi:MAG: nitroreductase family protein [Anaerolineae bacterium]|nr:nitroreductase family protein [Anaerolineae bacterium]MDW8069922.1 nitroreductase family protein [Anaerolineae bacterium]